MRYLTGAWDLWCLAQVGVAGLLLLSGWHWMHKCMQFLELAGHSICDAPYYRSIPWDWCRKKHQDRSRYFCVIVFDLEYVGACNAFTQAYKLTKGYIRTGANHLGRGKIGDELEVLASCKNSNSRGSILKAPTSHNSSQKQNPV